jgi:hypothetical protein
MKKEGSTKEIDLEQNFPGMYYSKCEGLLDKGKRKNIYFETYSDSDDVRVWQGNSVTRESTEVSFLFYFVGENRHTVFKNFYEYVKNGIFIYRDTKRKKKARLVLEGEVSPSKDLWYGSHVYIEATFKFKNLWGECKDV